MDKEFLKKAISQQLNAINEQFDIIKNHDKKIPQIELDILLANLREMYEYLYALDKINRPGVISVELKDRPTRDEVSPTVEKVEEEPKKEEQPRVQAPEPVKDDQPEPARVEEPVEEKSIKEPEQRPKTKSKPVQPPRVETTEKPAPAAQKETAGTNGDSTKTLADKLTRGDEVRIADKMGQQIDSLKRSIGINEKFLFINELFNGKLTEYNKAIKQLDEMPDAESCINEFNKLSDAYNWDKESETYLKLVRFIEKKHQEVVK
jgi:hypothetical protein